MPRIPMTVALLPVLLVAAASTSGAPAGAGSKGSVSIPNDDFFAVARSPSEPLWVKFVLRASDPTRVVFQDSRRYPFHYDFVRNELDGYLGISRAELDRISLHATDQELILGAVLVPPAFAPNEFAVELVRHDSYTAAEVAAHVARVVAAVEAPAGARAFYFPVANQRAAAEARRAELERLGVRVGGVEQWRLGDACYSPGWAIGTLRWVPGDEIEDAYQDGRLTPHDILVTDLVPAEIPYLAGVLSLLPSTPSSHVAILAQDWGVPFAHVAGPELRARVSEWQGREVLVRALRSFGPCEVRLDLVPGSVSPAERALLRELLEPEPVLITPAARRGQLALPAAELEPSDLRYVGGKAAHYGLLRDAIPANSQDAFAFTFDLWQGFLDQRLANGKVLRAEIDDRLRPFAWPPDAPSLRAALADVRTLIEKDTQFSPAQRATIERELRVFDPLRRIRFRSSTNFEDTEGFTGAGLYESASGCLADDQDQDEVGPSRCDAAQPKERGVFRAIRVVYASFYNDNAFRERLRRGVRESDLAMGMLVHHSYPDEIEMANGVLLTSNGCVCPVDVTAQVGAVSVTNPDSGEVPEQTQVLDQPALVRESSLRPRGDTELAWPAEYQQLERLARTVAAEYARRVPGAGEYRLEMEWKKVVPGRLELKQVRRVPVRRPTSERRFVLDTPVQLCVTQGELGSVTGIHRLKARLDLSLDSRFLDATGLATSLYTHSRYQSRRADGQFELAGAPATWPDAAFRASANSGQVTTHDSFHVGDGAARWRIELVTEVPASGEVPVITSAELTRLLVVRYATPQIHLEPNASPTTRREDFAVLGPCAENWPGDPTRREAQQRTARGPGGTEVRSSFEWPEPPSGPTAGYTAPAVRFLETTISGLFGTSLRLRGHYSQTYRPAHHNFGEELLFEPARDEGIDAGVARQLSAQGIDLIYATAGFGTSSLVLVSSDGTRGAPPATETPRDATARAAGEHAIDLSWRDVSGGASEFEVERSTGSGFVPIARLAAGQTSLRVADLRPATAYTFRVRARRSGVWSLYSNETTARTAGAGGCATTADALCLAQRFLVRARFRDQYHGGVEGTGRAIAGTETTGLFWFWHASNLELAVKVLDGRPVNGKFWLFYGALSDVEYWLDVLDTETGALRTYHNLPGSFCGRGDVDAFAEAVPPAATTGPLATPLVVQRLELLAQPVDRAERAAGVCLPAPTRLCLRQRYAVEVSWRAADGTSGAGSVIPDLTTDRSGGFSFFRAGNYELILKLLDGAPVNGHQWLFFGALSDVEYEVRLEDTETGAVRRYHNTAGTLCGQRDVSAF